MGAEALSILLGLMPVMEFTGYMWTCSA